MKNLLPALDAEFLGDGDDPGRGVTEVKCSRNDEVGERLSHGGKAGADGEGAGVGSEERGVELEPIGWVFFRPVHFGPVGVVAGDLDLAMEAELVQSDADVGGNRVVDRHNGGDVFGLDLRAEQLAIVVDSFASRADVGDAGDGPLIGRRSADAEFQKRFPESLGFLGFEKHGRIGDHAQHARVTAAEQVAGEGGLALGEIGADLIALGQIHPRGKVDDAESPAGAGANVLHDGLLDELRTRENSDAGSHDFRFIDSFAKEALLDGWIRIAGLNGADCQPKSRVVAQSPEEPFLDRG